MSKSIVTACQVTGIASQTGAHIPLLEALTRRVYELHRGRPAWDKLNASERSRLIAAYWRARASYEVGQREPRETRIEGAA